VLLVEFSWKFMNKSIDLSTNTSQRNLQEHQLSSTLDDEVKRVLHRNTGTKNELNIMIFIIKWTENCLVVELMG
jgi:hypothetical protein